MGPLAVVGLGLIGTSVVLASKRAWPDLTIIGLDRHDTLDGLARAEIIVLATPVDVTLDLLTRRANLLRHALVIDTGSTKQAIVAAAAAANLEHFVGGHPMAGGTTPGPADARADLFDDKVWFLVPVTSQGDAPTRAREFVEGLGARAVMMSDSGADHDRLMAAISHLPQVVASALMRVAGDAVGDERLSLAGAGLRDTTRLAASDAGMWTSVLRSNAAELRPLLIRLATELHTIADRLEDEDAVQRLFGAANRYRDRLN
jgi:prephenate dehydrogenase